MREREREREYESVGLTYERGVLQIKLVELLSTYNSKVLSQADTAARLLGLELLNKNNTI